MKKMSYSYKYRKEGEVIVNRNDLWDEIVKRVEELISLQKEDGSWRFCFEGGIVTDIYFILLCQVLGKKEVAITSSIVSKLLERQSDDGGWRLHADQETGDLSMTIQAYVGIRASGIVSYQDERLQRAEKYIIQKGGLTEADLITKLMLCLHNLYAYPQFLYIPTTIFLLKPTMLFSFYEFGNYARVHLASMIILTNKRKNFPLEQIPHLSHLFGERQTPSTDQRYNERFSMKEILQSLSEYSPPFHKKGYQAGEEFLLKRVESNGTLYSYATSTIYMIYALLALGYSKENDVIQKAFQGLKSLYNYECQHLENSPSTIWDTGLIAYTLQQAGVDYRYITIRRSVNYLLKKQHTKKGDWKIHAPNAYPGGWGFSDINTIVPDIDDTSVALRAIYLTSLTDEKVEKAFNRGVEWLLSMQNDDGGWAAFEKNTNNELFTHIPIQYAQEVLIDPSTADLTGRALDFLGNYTSFTTEHPSIQKAIDWAFQHQEENGSWYGKWGICYVYGTWAMLTGLQAVGYTGGEIEKGCKWLLSVQREDGGWGESCYSSVKKQYVPLPFSTPSQTAWAVHALIVCGYAKHPAVKKGIMYLLNYHSKVERTYPTGTGLPGSFYIYYHSYNDIFPLLALSSYYKTIT